MRLVRLYTIVLILSFCSQAAMTQVLQGLKEKIRKENFNLNEYSINLMTSRNNGHKDIELTCATGFFASYRSKMYLVTNYHVLTGRSSLGNKIKSSLGLTPNYVHIYLRNKKNGLDTMDLQLTTDRIQKDSLQFLTVKTSDTTWLDIAIYPISLNPGFPIKLHVINLDSVLIKQTVSYPNLISIWGYKSCIRINGLFPACEVFNLKKGIAFKLSEYIEFDAETTYQGMSGSPVFYHTTTKSPRFIGIFSSTISSRNKQTNKLELNDGIVIGAELISDVIKEGYFTKR